MKNLITYLKALWGAWGNLQSSDVRHDCRRSDLRRSPSGFNSKLMLKLVSVLVLILTIGVGNVWGQAAINTVLWGENFGHFSAGQTPSTAGTGSGTTIYGGATISYAQSSSNTKAYAEALASGTSPELLIAKSSTTWTIKGIKTGGATQMALTFLSNKTTFQVTVSSSNLEVTGSGKSWTISLKSGKTDPGTFNLVIKNTGSSNARVDNVVLKVTTAGSSKTLSSIAITTQPTTTKYLVGETFSKTGAVVTATYSDATTANVTASASWTPTTGLVAGSNTITASYTEGGITKTATSTVTAYSVTVQKKDEDGTTIADAGVTASASGRTLTASAGSTHYVFKTWKYGTASGTSIASATSASTSLTGTPSAAVTVIAEFYKPCTVTWSVNGSTYQTTSNVSYNTTTSTPADPSVPGECTGSTFMGWTSNSSWASDSAPGDLFNGTSPTITGNITFYAVFADEN